MTATYQVFGGPGSPYSHKLKAYLRYKRIPHLWTVPQGEFSGDGALLGSDAADSELARAGKGVLPVLKCPDGTYLADTTPVILELDRRHSERAVLPEHAGLAFVARLVEDLADEFLCIPMFHFRWTIDQEWCGRRQMVGWTGAIDDETLAASSRAFLARQAGQLAKAAVDPAQMERACERFYAAMEALLSKRLFLLGSRPSIADFALYGQLTQYAVDPTLANRMKETAIRTFQWTHTVDDLSGADDGAWGAPTDVLDDATDGLLSLVAEFYLPMGQRVLAVAKDEDLARAVNGLAYRAKTFLDLKRQLAELAPPALDAIRPCLERTGCWDGLQLRAGEKERAVPLRVL